MFAAACILDRFANVNADEAELVRPMVVAVLAAMLVLLVSVTILGNIPWASLVASIVVLLFLRYPAPLGAVAALAIWWLLIGLRSRRTEGAVTRLHHSDAPLRIAGIFCVVLLILNAWTVGQTLTGRGGAQDALPHPTSSGGPDVYVLILDGYPRGDTIRDLGFDNGRFEDRLEELGFSVAQDARSNYTKTWLTVGSFLSTRYIHELPALAEPPASPEDQVRLLHDVINDAPVLEYFRARGYQIVSIPSPTMRSDVTRGAHLRKVGNLAGFEIALVSSFMSAVVAPSATLRGLAADAREYSGHQLANWSSPKEDDGPARLVLAHLMSPHPPFVLGQEPEYLHGCFPECSVWTTTAGQMELSAEEYGYRMETQLSVLNQMVNDATERIIASDPAAVIIVMSDHGARYSLERTDEHFRIFFASRTPGRDAVFPEDVSPVNVFRRLLSTYFDENLPDMPYEAWLSDWEIPLLLSRQE